LACHFCPATLAEIPINDENTEATRKRLGMHVLLIEVEERNSERKILSILGKERGNMGKNSRPSKRWTMNCQREVVCIFEELS
jgi:hypothetical protein